MSFFNHTASWIKGELFEAYFIASFGVLTILGGFLFWRLGSTPNSRALLLPLVITGLIYSAIGISMVVSNHRRLPLYEQSCQKDNVAFIQAEKQRVESFQYGYTVSKIVASICFPLTLLLFWLSRNPNLQALGVGLALFALSGLVVDYFSQERADTYYQQILEAQKQVTH